MMCSQSQIQQLRFADGQRTVDKQHITLDIGSEIVSVFADNGNLGFRIGPDGNTSLGIDIPVEGGLFGCDRLFLKLLDLFIFRIRHDTLTVFQIGGCAIGLLRVKIHLPGDDLTVGIAVDVGQHMGLGIIVNHHGNMVKIRTGTIPGKEDQTARLIGNVEGINVRMHKMIPIII